MTLPESATDVLIVGAGPAGLALALALDDAGLRCTVLDHQPEHALAAPAPDGRDIALTHRAELEMRTLGLWQHLPEAEVAPLREAAVYNGHARRPLRFVPQGSGQAQLGHLVPNHVIRQASWDAVCARPGIARLTGAKVVGLAVDRDAATLTWKGPDGATRTLAAPLVVAADSRHSGLRRLAGIGAQMRDFGRSVIVCRMRHGAPNGAVAQECFQTGQTLAVLPLNGGRSSIVVTVPADRAAAMMAWPDAAFTRWVQQQLGARLGEMALEGERHLYPLVAVYAHRFAAPRVALVGDAAVGMHPVTAHGYNFGLYGVRALAQALGAAHREGRDLGALATLQPYAAQHRRETFAVFHGTNAIVGLFTDDRAAAMRLREAVVAVADRLPPLKAAITQRLTAASAPRGLPWPPSPAALWRTLRERAPGAHQ